MIIAKDDKKISDTIIELRKKYTITDEGNMVEYLDIQLEYTGNSIRISQPLVTERIIDAIPGTRNANPVNHPAIPSVTLTNNEQD